MAVMYNFAQGGGDSMTNCLKYENFTTNSTSFSFTYPEGTKRIIIECDYITLPRTFQNAYGHYSIDVVNNTYELGLNVQALGATTYPGGGSTNGVVVSKTGNSIRITVSGNFKNILLGDSTATASLSGFYACLTDEKQEHTTDGMISIPTRVLARAHGVYNSTRLSYACPQQPTYIAVHEYVANNAAWFFVWNGENYLYNGTTVRTDYRVEWNGTNVYIYGVGDPGDGRRYDIIVMG